MTAPRLRRPDLVKQDPLRDWMRERCPTGSEGFIAEDLDLVVRWFGPKWGLDSAGLFVLIEVKYGSAPLGESKRRTFGMLDMLLRQADPTGDRYGGFYMLRHNHRGDDPWQPDEPIIFGKARMTVADFTAWLHGKPIPDVRPHFTDGEFRP